jgi:hypothetical protein
MGTITIPLELFIETDQDKLPNGPYCLGGPTGNTVNKLDVHVPEYTTHAKLREIVMAHLLQKLAESGHSNGGQPVPGNMNTTSPNTVQFVNGLIPMGITLSIDSIRFRGGELGGKQDLTAGDGYEVVMTQSAVYTGGCCNIL